MRVFGSFSFFNFQYMYMFIQPKEDSQQINFSKFFFLSSLLFSFLSQGFLNHREEYARDNHNRRINSNPHLETHSCLQSKVSVMVHSCDIDPHVCLCQTGYSLVLGSGQQVPGGKAIRFVHHSSHLQPCTLGWLDRYRRDF